jgi:hypothetical protein
VYVPLHVTRTRTSCPTAKLSSTITRTSPEAVLLTAGPPDKIRKDSLQALTCKCQPRKWAAHARLFVALSVLHTFDRALDVLLHVGAGAHVFNALSLQITGPGPQVHRRSAGQSS